VNHDKRLLRLLRRGGGAELFNNATQVVLMREGTRTVLSMQNNYQGPPEDFAMVIPVPVVLKKEQVKTLPRRGLRSRRHALGAAPRRVLGAGPLLRRAEEEYRMVLEKSGGAVRRMKRRAAAASARSVKVEARFEVGEYDVVILSAKDALALELWLKQNKYKIPEGAEPLLRPYVQQGLKFFVAKVNSKKVTFEKGMAKLSPLRFHYDTEKFELPVRLGLINAKEKQDLIVHVLARNQRYELANLPNVTIPTNIDLAPSAKSEFPFFYVSLFDRTLAKNPKAVITEYAWQATSCDPCPTSPLSQADFATLGADVHGDGGRFAPALTELGAPITGHELADTDRCAACHADVAAQWQGSAHALASFNNPIYRTSVERFRETRGDVTSRFCAGCHDPALLVDDAMDAPEIAAADPRAHAGVNCQTCHTIDRATHDGNGSYHLRGGPIFIPDASDPASVAAHKLEARTPALGTAAMCGSCHRAFLGPQTGQPHHLPGADDLGPWLHSAYAGSEARLDDPRSRGPAAPAVTCHASRRPAATQPPTPTALSPRTASPVATRGWRRCAATRNSWRSYNKCWSERSASISRPSATPAARCSSLPTAPQWSPANASSSRS
jgi:hypothetical protein